MAVQRKADGRRVFTPEFKREQVHRVLQGETTIAELSRVSSRPIVYQPFSP